MNFHDVIGIPFSLLHLCGVCAVGGCLAYYLVAHPSSMALLLLVQLLQFLNAAVFYGKGIPGCCPGW